MVLYNTPCLASFLLIDRNQESNQCLFCICCTEIEWCRTTETPIFGIQGNDLTDQIERKGRNESPYGIPQDAFCFSIETLGYRNGTLITMVKSGF